jgi:hypothetical protein
MGVMTNLTSINVFGANYYRLNVNSAAKYRGGDFGSFATAPLIHTYSARLESVSPRLALRQDAQSIQVGNKQYQIMRFLTVQPLNASLVSDEAGDFRPTVKPHYAIAFVNGRGTIYDQSCKTLIIDVLGSVIENRKLPVHVHDGLLSPAVSISNLKEQLILAQNNEQSKFYTSYVVDEINNQILVTQHCLLSEMDHELLCQTLDQMKTPTLEGLVAARTSVKDALVRLHQPVTAEDPAIKAVFSGNSLSISPVIKSPSLTSSPIESDSETAPLLPHAITNEATDQLVAPSDKENDVMFGKAETSQLKVPVINHNLIRYFKKNLKSLEKLDEVLQKKYDNDVDKRYIIITNQHLINQLNSALTDYEKLGTNKTGNI